MNEIKHTLGQAWLQRAKELAQERADSSFAYGELPPDVDDCASADAYAPLARSRPLSRCTPSTNGAPDRRAAPGRVEDRAHFRHPRRCR